MNRNERRKILQKQVKEDDKSVRQKMDEYHRRQKEILKFLKEKSKKLNKKIPHIVLVVATQNIPIGSWFFKEYNEWIE